MTATATAHLWLDERGVAWIDETNVKVIEIALDRIANEWSAEEIQLQAPYVSLAQIHAALAYYYDHQREFYEQIARDREEVRQLAAHAADSPLRRRLPSLGKLPMVRPSASTSIRSASGQTFWGCCEVMVG
jgi:uncharacterized protein (DUF433 family)